MKTRKMFSCTIDEEDGELVTFKMAPVNLCALLALADEMHRDGKMQRERQKAGDHWLVDGLDVMEYAERIREALGVTDG